MIGSTTGERPLYGRTPHAASERAFVGLERTLAVELGPLGVRVNLISPGAVAGPRIESVIREQARVAGGVRRGLRVFLDDRGARRLRRPERTIAMAAA